MAWRYLSLLLGVFACSVSVILIKASHTHAMLIPPARLLLAVAALAPLFFLELRRHRAAFTSAHLRRTTLPALVLALHFISWTYGARTTYSAQATLIVNLVPVAIPFFLHPLAGEKITRPEILGTVITIAGLLLLNAHDALSGSGDVLGNLVCFGSMLLFAWYLALGRANRDFPSLWLYVIPVYFQAGLFSLLAAIPWLDTFAYDSLYEWSLLAGLAFIPTIIGHSLLNNALRQIRGQVVSLCNAAQFIFAGVMAFFLFHETPTVLFLIASAIVSAGIAIVVLATPTTPPRLR
jgi:Permeases of the drug/metabolite transporter (DMT) superfamily